MEDLLSCTVCCEPYHEKHRQPVVLPRCGHSFCRPCIAFMVSKGCIVCPSCRTDQRVEGADSLPTEFSLLAISCAQQATKQESCLSHGVKLSFWCKTCNISACGECLFEDHPMTSHVVIKSTAYITEMKDSVTNITNKFMEALDGREKQFFEKIFLSTKMVNDALRTITVLRKDMESARELMKGVKIVEGICNTQALSESAKFLGLKWNLQDVNLALGTLVPKKEESKDEEEDDEEDEGKEDEESKVEEICVQSKEEAINGVQSKTEVLANTAEESSENGTNEKEKADNENEKDIDEEENLTEEEKRKRRKIQKLKERLAAATAAAELAKLEAQEKIGSKKDKAEGTKEKKAEEDNTDGKAAEEKKAEDENKDSKSSGTSGREAYAVTSKNLKTWQKKSKPYEPVPREPSITPEREIRRKKSITTTEIQETDKKADEKEKDNKAEEAKESDQRKLKESVSKEDIRAENNTATMKSSKSASRESINTTETNALTDSNADVKNELDPELKKSYLNGTKKPRGRMARNALKRAQTMDFSKRVENQDLDSEKEPESENIKGLDLETPKTNKVSEGPELDNKETDGEVTSEKKEEKEDGPVEVPKEKKKERKKRVKKVEPKPQKEKDMFEMEPEEKERIATELMQVPSLTVCVEGAGGLLARIAWESMGLHIYCHQFQELPYDVIIKSNVLHALIPTKDPMVFLDIGTDDQTLGRVYITLWGHLRRASNFLLLCLGDRGHSFRLSRLFDVVNTDAPGERLQGGDYEYNNGRGGEALVDDLEYQGKYAMPMEMGMVTAASGIRSLDSQFYICTEEDLTRQFGCPFGRVTVGLPVLKEAVWLSVNSQIWIQDCGVVLDCPRI